MKLLILRRERFGQSLQAFVFLPIFAFCSPFAFWLTPRLQSTRSITEHSNAAPSTPPILRDKSAEIPRLQPGWRANVLNQAAQASGFLALLSLKLAGSRGAALECDP